MIISRHQTLSLQHSTLLLGPRQTGKSTLVKSLLPPTAFSVHLLQTDVFIRYSQDPSRLRKEVLYQLSQ